MSGQEWRLPFYADFEDGDGPAKGGFGFSGGGGPVPGGGVGVGISFGVVDAGADEEGGVGFGGFERAPMAAVRIDGDRLWLDGVAEGAEAVGWGVELAGGAVEPAEDDAVLSAVEGGGLAGEVGGEALVVCG